MGVWDRERIRTKIGAVADGVGRVDPQQLKQLLATLEGANSEEVFEGLFAALTSDGRFVVQELAGRLLFELAPPCPRRDLDSIVRALLPAWELSVEQVPRYFEREFGTELLHRAIRRVGVRDLSPDEERALGAFGHWVHCSVAEPLP